MAAGPLLVHPPHTVHVRQPVLLRPYYGQRLTRSDCTAVLWFAGNMLTGSIPAITSPVLYVDLSNNMLDANLTASLQALPADAFSATLVLDLSGNKLFGALPPAPLEPLPTPSNAWLNLLATAVRIDLSGGHGTVHGCTRNCGLKGRSTQLSETPWLAWPKPVLPFFASCCFSLAANALTGPLPPSWSSLLDDMDLLLHNNTGLRGRVPEEWLAAVKKADWFGRGKTLDFTGCSGLDGWTYDKAADYRVLRVGGGLRGVGARGLYQCASREPVQAQLPRLEGWNLAGF